MHPKGLFYAEGEALKKRHHLVDWTTVFLDKKKGGLGIKNITIFNKALLCKWHWHFANQRSLLKSSYKGKL